MKTSQCIEISCDGCKALANACANGALGQLTRLSLYWNKIGVPGCTALAEACGRGAMAKLEYLDLGNNKIGDEGLEALANACISGLQILEELTLECNMIGDRGCNALAESCTKGALQKLRYLSLLENYNIGDAGFTSLAEVIDRRKMPLLTDLAIDKPFGAHSQLENVCTRWDVELYP